MFNQHTFIQYSESMNLPDTIYNGRYNKEPAIIRFKGGIPVWVQFCGFIKHYEGQDEVRSNCIYDPRGIMHSNVEILLPAQKLSLIDEQNY